MPGRWALLVALGVGALMLLVAAPSSAQDEGSGEAADVSPGFLYLSDQEVGTTASDLCRPVEETRTLFGLSAPVPRDEDADKVPANKIGGGVTCATFFTHQARTGFTMGAGAQVTFWVGCERPMPVYSTSRVDPFTDYRVELFHNGERVTQYEGEYSFSLNPLGFCGPNVEPRRFEAPLDPPETTIASGDNLTLEIELYGMMTDRDDVYLSVQSTQTPSAFYGPGFPGLLRDSLQSNLLVDAGNLTGNTGPGNATTYTFTVENVGNESRPVRLSVDGPEPWFAEPSSSALEVPAGETVEANLTVAAPGDLVGGAEARHLITVASGEEAVTFDKTTTVVPGQGEAAPELLEVSLTEESGSAVGELIDEFSIELAATAVVGVGAFVSKQFLS